MAQEKYFEQAGKAMFNLGLTGIGMHSAMDELAGKVKNTLNREPQTPWPLMVGLADDNLMALTTIPRQAYAQPDVTVELSDVNGHPLDSAQVTFSVLA
jgi:hypothetical protein